MRRLIIIAAVAGAIAATAAAQAQPVQYQFTPPPPVVPLSPQPAVPDQVSGASPYDYAGRHSARSSHHRTQYAQTRHGRLVAVPPGRPGYNTFGDRVLRCQQAASQAGLGASQQGSFAAQCAN
ncbi:MAG: hypothetical protein JO001_04710 [Alphaproteobacteria bacterium]|nr:hypothetical protein [Alphaproteobacteria bacterium]